VTCIKPWPQQTCTVQIFVVGSFGSDSGLSKGSILRDRGVTSLIIMRGGGDYQVAGGPLIYVTALRLPNSWTPSRKSVTSRNFPIAICNTISHPCFRILVNPILNEGNTRVQRRFRAVKIFQLKIPKLRQKKLEAPELPSKIRIVNFSESFLLFSVLQETDHSSQCVAVFPQITYLQSFTTVTTCEEKLEPNSY